MKACQRQKSPPPIVSVPPPPLSPSGRRGLHIGGRSPDAALPWRCHPGCPGYCAPLRVLRGSARAVRAGHPFAPISRRVGARRAEVSRGTGESCAGLGASSRRAATHMTSLRMRVPGPGRPGPRCADCDWIAARHSTPCARPTAPRPPRRPTAPLRHSPAPAPPDKKSFLVSFSFPVTEMARWFRFVPNFLARGAGWGPGGATIR